MTASDDSLDYTKNPFFQFHEKSDYSLFYVTLALCFLFLAFLLIVNIYFCCFSEYSHYWNDSYTGNSWIFPLWVRGPSKQAPLDLTELEWAIKTERPIYQVSQQGEFLELSKKESAI